MVVARDREMDTRRVDVSEAVKRQRRLMRDDTTAQSPRHGGRKIVMLSGDNTRTAQAIAKQAGIDEAYGDLLPDQSHLR